MARRIRYEYDNCRGNVPTKPMGTVDWTLLALLTVVVIGFLVFIV